MLNKHEAKSVDDLKNIIMSLKEPIILKFKSNSCGPCMELAKDLENFNPPEDINIIEVDVTKSMELPRKYNVRSIPHLIKINKNLEMIDDKIGYSDFNNFKEWLYK
ncbi:Thioredoxin [Astathelohania contejeani]|uniref:Thioredoxin n=1 Tax=Astathelohania contejeani TaxID=164912 RepID=A0ABQ7HVP8_9MICR|nr:Thioredoxin [Thelohania contejeani]